MLTPDQRDAYEKANVDLDALVVRDIRALIESLRITDRQVLTDLIIDMMPKIVAQYSDASAIIASDFYELAREQANARGRFTPKLAKPAPLAQIEASAGWSLQSVWQEVIDFGALLVNLNGSMTRLVRQAGRATVAENAQREGVGWYRAPDAGACSFCLMLASRGAVYATEAGARFVGINGRVRGNQQAGEKYHDNCGCVPTRIARSEALPPEIEGLERTWATVTQGYSGDQAIKVWDEYWAAKAA